MSQILLFEGRFLLEVRIRLQVIVTRTQLLALVANTAPLALAAHTVPQAPTTTHTKHETLTTRIGPQAHH